MNTSTPLIRPIRPDDNALLAGGFERLSHSPRYRHFLSPHAVVSPAELRYFTDRARAERITR
jgi:hypothetical protein